jgi:hypothetical protein
VGKSAADIREILRKMAKNPDSLKVTAKGQILHCNGWLLIQIDNSIVTVYQGDESRMLHQKVRGRIDDKRTRSQTIDGYAIARNEPPSRSPRKGPKATEKMRQATTGRERRKKAAHNKTSDAAD